MLGLSSGINVAGRRAVRQAARAGRARQGGDLSHRYATKQFNKAFLEDPLWRYGCALPGMLCAAQLALCFALLESPFWLKAQQRTEAAERVVQKLRGTGYVNVAAAGTVDDDGADDDRNTGHDSDTNCTGNEDENKLICNTDAEDANATQEKEKAGSASLWQALRRYPVIRRIFIISLFIHVEFQITREVLEGKTN